MPHDPLPRDEPAAGRLSPNGQMACIGAYGFLVLVGFFFGVVTGYDSPKPAAKPPKEKEVARPDPRPAPKVVPPKPEPREEPKPEPKEEPRPAEPKPVEMKKEEPKPAEPPKKVDPKPADPPRPEPTPVAVAVSFEKQVKPILMRYCGNCHGNAGKPKGDVDLRTLAAITDPKNPPILKPGDPKGSQLLATIEDGSMPPPKNPQPGKGETELIRDWIKGGAKPRRRREKAI